MKAYSKNPWLVENIDEFNFLCCPECAYKSKDEVLFETHAIENHPKSSVLFEKAEGSDKTTIVKKKPTIVNVVKENVPVSKDSAMIDIATIQEYSQLHNENEQESVMVELDSIKQDFDDEIFMATPGATQIVEIKEENQVSDDDVIGKNPFYSCPHCEKMFTNFDNVSLHIEMKHESVQNQQVVKCFECKQELPRDHEAIKNHMKTKHMGEDDRQELGLPDIINTDTGTMLRLNSKERIKWDPEKKKFACAYCGDKFPDKSTRAMHERNTHVDKGGNLLKITCKMCDEILTSSVHFRRHAIDKHKKYNLTNSQNKAAYCCDECGKTFKFNKYLTHHKRTAHIDKSQKNFKCDLCDFSTYAKRYITDHKQKVHDNREFKHMCDKCGEKFKYPYYLRVHICPDRQLMPEELKCDPCGLQFTSSRYYMRHFLRQHKTVPPGYENQEVYKCNEQNCDDIFLTPFNLQKHIKIYHSDLPKKSKTEPDEQKYCSRCDQSFAKERFFLMHYKTIHNEIPPEYKDRQQFVCQSCDYFCFSKMGLDLHIANKHSKNPVQKRPSKLRFTPVNCPMCDKQLSSEQRLKQHIANIHETNKAFSCPSCHKAFGTMQGKRQHLKVAKACGKKVAKLENQAAKRQQTKTVSRDTAAAIVTSGTVTTTQQQTWFKNEAQTAVESLMAAKW